MESSVVVTGAASGLGRIIAAGLLARGGPVVVLDRDAEQADAVAGELFERHGMHVPVVAADLSTIAESAARPPF